jgi:hypothetical protein
MVSLNRSADRNRRRERFRSGRRGRHAKATERSVHRCNKTRELIGSDLVLRDITANDGDHQAAIELLRDAFLAHFPNQRLLDPIWRRSFSFSNRLIGFAYAPAATRSC